MKRILILLFSSDDAHSLFTRKYAYQTGITADQNLKAIGNLAPYSTGGLGFDTRYEGTKGSPYLLEPCILHF